MTKKFLALLTPLAILTAASASAPAFSQASSYIPGEYWDTTLIDVTDGQEETYMDWLAGEWRRNQEFAKSKGWISEYHILTNLYPRPGEPDIYIVTKFKQMYSADEQRAQQKEYEAFMKKDARRMTDESGKRGSFRKVVGGQLFQELLLK